MVVAFYQSACARLSIPGAHLKGIVAAGDVAKWYNGYAEQPNSSDSSELQTSSGISTLSSLLASGEGARDVRIRADLPAHLTIIG